MMVMVDSNYYQWISWNTKKLATSCWPLLPLSFLVQKKRPKMWSTILVCIPERTISCLHPGAGYPVFSLSQEELCGGHMGHKSPEHSSTAHILSVSGNGSPASLGLSLAVQPKVWWGGLRVDQRDRVNITGSFWSAQRQNEKNMASYKNN